jgi:hypothetical protein
MAPKPFQDRIEPLRYASLKSAMSRENDKPRNWMYGVPSGYLVNVCEAVEALLAASDAAPIPLTSATAMRWDDLCRAAQELRNAG